MNGGGETTEFKIRTSCEHSTRRTQQLNYVNVLTRGGGFVHSCQKVMHCVLLDLLSFLKGFKFVGTFFRSGHKMEKDVLGGTKAVSLALEWTVWSKKDDEMEAIDCLF